MSIIIGVLAAAIVILLIVILTEVLRLHDHLADATELINRVADKIENHAMEGEGR